jgi:hypothetical protein
MNNEIKELLESELKSEIANLASLQIGSAEHTAAIESVNKLYRLKLEETKTELDENEKDYKRKSDDREYELKVAQLKNWFVDLVAKYGVEIGLTIFWIIFYSIKFNKGLKFEETGTYTSKTFMNFMGNIKPKRK